MKKLISLFSLITLTTFSAGTNTSSFWSVSNLLTQFGFTPSPGSGAYTNPGGVSFVQIVIKTNGVPGSEVFVRINMSDSNTNLFNSINLLYTNTIFKIVDTTSGENFIMLSRGGFGMQTNFISTIPAAPFTFGQYWFFNSNGVPYIILSTNGAGGGTNRWTSTNKFVIGL